MTEQTESGDACPLKLPSFEDWVTRGGNPNEWMEEYGKRERDLGAIEAYAILSDPDIDTENGDTRYEIADALNRAGHPREAAMNLADSLTLPRARIPDYDIFKLMASAYEQMKKPNEEAYARALALHEGRKSGTYQEWGKELEEHDEFYLKVALKEVRESRRNQ